MNRTRPIISLIGWTVGLVGLLVTLIRLDSHTGGSPPLSSPTAAMEWLEHLEPALVGFTIVRLGAIVAVAYLMLVTAVALSARLTDRATLVRAADRVTVPAVRHLVGRSVGLGITASVIVSTGPALAGPTATPNSQSTSSITTATTTTATTTTATTTTATITTATITTPTIVPTCPRTSPRTSQSSWCSSMTTPGPGPTNHGRAKAPPRPRNACSTPSSGTQTIPPPPTSTPATSRPPTASGSAPSTSTPEGGASSPTSAPATEPPNEPPAGSSAPTEEPPAVSETWTIQPGEHLWAVAAESLADHGNARPTNGEIAAYLDVLIEANRHRLADPNNPDLVYPGQVIELPPLTP